jgi:sulfofructose kinase
MHPCRLICLGHAAHDTIYRVRQIPSSPVKVLASARVESGGGMAANASVAAHRLGADVRLWSRVGDDALGARIIAELGAEGIDVTGVRRVPGGHSTSTAILVDERGERLICSYVDPDLDRDPGWLPVEVVADCDAVLADVRWREGAARLLDAARTHGVPGVFDGDVGPVDALRDLAARASHTVFSTPGLALAAGSDDPGAALARIAAAVPGLVGVTLGADGFLWREGGREHRAPAPAIRAVDTLAAGDVWHGAFTVALGERRPVAEAARFANVAAALKCLRPGGRSGAPGRAEVAAALVSFPS